jgi:hypothetical protein
MPSTADTTLTGETLQMAMTTHPLVRLGDLYLEEVTSIMEVTEDITVDIIMTMAAAVDGEGMVELEGSVEAMAVVAEEDSIDPQSQFFYGHFYLLGKKADNV